MAKYFFHLRTGDDFVKDLEGIDLPDIHAVEEEALQAAREIVAEIVRNGEHAATKRFEIADEDGNIVAVFPFMRTVLELRAAD